MPGSVLESMPVELDGLAKMRKKIFSIVTTGIQMKLMRHLFRGELLVHDFRAFCESVFILLAAVDIDELTPDLRLIFSRQLEGIVLVPMRSIYGSAEHFAQ